MNNQELSNEFDIWYNNITSNQAPGLDEYEKSVFLTRGQDDILKSYFDPRTNKPQRGYDGSSIRQIDFSMVTTVQDYTAFSPAILDPRSNSKSVTLSNNILIPINEYIEVKRGEDNKLLQVIPIEYNEYRRLMSKAHKRPYKSQAWRLLNTSNGSNKSDLIVGPRDVITKYSIRYVKRPKPIILYDLEDGLSIDGYTTAQTCELDPILKQELIQRAAELAKAAYIGDLQSQLILGNTSQTNIGVTPSN